MPGTPQFTVFTATYNRAHTIDRVYNSLRAQTLRDFEWLVIDDGSTDNTAQAIATWAKTAAFPIRYIRQDHAGKHFAHNRAAREARGELFVTLDSDDACAPETLERIAHHWRSIPPGERAAYSGVGTLCRNQFGKIVGDRYPSDVFDAGLPEILFVRRVKGEKWYIVRTDLVRRYPLPEIRDTQFVPEGTVWLDIGKSYKTRCVNEILRTYYVDDVVTGPVLSKRHILTENAPGRLHYYVWLLNNQLAYVFHSPMPFLKAAVMLPIVAAASGQGLRATLRSLNNRSAKSLVLFTLLFSILIRVLANARLVRAWDNARARATPQK